jgi:lipoyl-dependent peroxiredoxin
VHASAPINLSNREIEQVAAFLIHLRQLCLETDFLAHSPSQRLSPSVLTPFEVHNVRRYDLGNWSRSESFNQRKEFMKRTASAVWRGDLKAGKGQLSTASGVLKETQYSFGTRFENGPGTNPEELIAAAHAGCFSMAFSAELGKAGITPESIATTATVTLDKTDAGFTVTQSKLEMTARIPGADKAKALEIANAAKAGCPISRLLKTEITLDAIIET